MDAVRESWTDERLDDLNDRVAEMGRRMDDGFNRVHEEIRALRTETKAEIGELRKETKAEFGALRGEIGALHRLILQVGGGMVVTMLIGFLGIATQL